MKNFMCPKCGRLGAGDQLSALCDRCNYKVEMIDVTNRTVWYLKTWNTLVEFNYPLFRIIEKETKLTFRPRHIKNWENMIYIGEL